MAARWAEVRRELREDTGSQPRSAHSRKRPGCAERQPGHPRAGNDFSIHNLYFHHGSDNPAAGAIRGWRTSRHPKYTAMWTVATMFAPELMAVLAKLGYRSCSRQANRGGRRGLTNSGNTRAFRSRRYAPAARADDVVFGRTALSNLVANSRHIPTVGVARVAHLSAKGRAPRQAGYQQMFCAG